MKHTSRKTLLLILLVFIELIFLTNSLNNPFYVLFGFIFLKGIASVLIKMLFLLVNVFILIGLIKKFGIAYKVAMIYYFIMLIDTIMFVIGFYYIGDEIISFIRDNVSSVMRYVIDLIDPSLYVITAVISIMIYSIIIFLLFQRKHDFTKNIRKKKY